MACSWLTCSFEAEMSPTTRAVSASTASWLPVAISSSSASSWVIVAAYSWITASEGIRVLVATLRRAGSPSIAVIAPLASCWARAG